MTYAENVSSCTPIPVITDDILLQPLQTNTWILFSRKEEILTRTCFDDISRQRIKGTFILTLDDQCEIKIGTFTLKRRQIIIENDTYPLLPVVNLPSIHLPKIPSLTPTNVKGIDLTDLKLLAYALKKSEISENSEKGGNSESNKIVTSISVWTIGLYILVLIIICVLVFKYYKFIERCFRSSPASPDNFDLKEGGVTSSQSADSAANVRSQSIF